MVLEAVSEVYHFPYHDSDDRIGNSTCGQWTSCTDCLDFFGGEDDSGCLWCNVPKGGGSDGLCVPRSIAQDSCEIGELQVGQGPSTVFPVATFNFSLLAVVFFPSACFCSRAIRRLFRINSRVLYGIQYLYCTLFVQAILIHSSGIRCIGSRSRA